MKRFIIIMLMNVATMALAQTFTNQADFDAYNFQSGTVYWIELNNDTNLPESEQISSLLPCMSITATLQLYIANSLVSSLDGIQNTSGVALFLEGNKNWDTLFIPDYIDTLYDLNCEYTFLRYIYGANEVKMLNQVELIDNDNLQNVNLSLSKMDSVYSPFGLRLNVTQNDSLKTFIWNNPNHLLSNIDFFENRQLKHVHLETVAEKISPISGSQGGFRFNIELDSISGCVGLDTVLSLSFKQNYILDNACVFQKGINNYLIDNPNLEQSFIVQNNAIGLKSLDDLLTADCSWLPNGVEEMEYNKLGLYPNPAYDEVFVSVPEKTTNYIIYDVSGKIVQQGTVESNGRIGISSISHGMYVLLVGDKRSKLIVQ